MTGFGKTTCEVRNKKITVEIKSLNSKQLDLFSRLPNVYKEKDLELRNVVAQKLERGKIEFSIYSESLGGESTSQMNFPIIESYYKQITEMSQRLGIEPPSDWFSLLLRLPESMKVEIQELDDEEWSVIRKAFDEAVDSLIEFRKQEGESLRAVFMEKLAKLEKSFEFPISGDTSTGRANEAIYQIQNLMNKVSEISSQSYVTWVHEK